MSEQTSKSPSSSRGITKPGTTSATRAPVIRERPCFVILVHGVNDLGEAFEAQEKGICQGLNERLDRKDLSAATYRMPSQNEEFKPEGKDPDEVLYRRHPKGDTRGPIIPFYWGFREKESLIQKGAKHGEWLDQYGNRMDKMGAKGGGPFANATNNIPAFWGNGAVDGKGTIGKGLNWKAGSPTHPLLAAQPRHYMILAALRLAALITSIRSRRPEAVINIVAHSQGCLVSLTAHAILNKEGKHPADCLIMQDPPYSLDDYSEKSARLFQFLDDIQTVHARKKTLENIVGHITGKPANSPEFKELMGKAGISTGIGGVKWLKHVVNVDGKDHAYEDRDNRGKVYLYFCPEDETVALVSIQGIGWQGVPDWALKPMLPRFQQRVFTMKMRDGKRVPVGQAAHTYLLRAQGEAFWAWAREGNTENGGKELSNRAEPAVGECRWVGGDTVPIPMVPQLHASDEGVAKNALDLGQGQLGVSPIDARVAITNGGIGKITETIDDPRPDYERSRFKHDIDLRNNYVQKIKSNIISNWKQKHNPKDLQEKTFDENQADLQDNGNGTLVLIRPETPEEAALRWQQRVTEFNSYHSAIPANPEHHRRITSYDLAIGPTSISKKQWMKEREEEDKAFLDYLCLMADWRMMPKDFNKLKENCFFAVENDSVQKTIEANSNYYKTGDAPYWLIPKIEELQKSIVNWTEAQEKSKQQAGIAHDNAKGGYIKGTRIG